MKNIYNAPVIEFNTVEAKDVITASLTNGGDGGSVYATVDLGELFL